MNVFRVTPLVVFSVYVIMAALGVGRMSVVYIGTDLLYLLGFADTPGRANATISLLPWAVAGGFYGGRLRTGALIAHAAGIALLLASVAASSGGGRADAALLLGLIVLLAMGAAWAVGRVIRLVFRRPVVDAEDVFAFGVGWPFAVFIVLPLLGVTTY